jgi:hypothetical protein
MYYYSMAKEVVDDSVSGTDNLLNNVKISKLHILQLVNEIAYIISVILVYKIYAISFTSSSYL